MGLKVEEAHQKLRTVITASWDAYTATARPRGASASASATGAAAAEGTGGAGGGGPRPSFQLPASLSDVAGLGEAAASTGGVVPSASLPARLEQSGTAANLLRQKILDTERALLYTLEFDVAVEHPYPVLKATVLAWKEQGLFGALFPRGKTLREAPLELTQAMVLANNLAFTMVGSDMCLRYSALELALASLSLAFTLIFVPQGRALPVSPDAFRKLADLRVLREVCDRFCLYLEEDAKADAEFRQAELDLSSGGGGGGGGGGSAGGVGGVGTAGGEGAGVGGLLAARAAAAAALAASSVSVAASFSEDLSYEPSPKSSAGSLGGGLVRPFVLGESSAGGGEEEGEDVDVDIGAPTLGAGGRT
jgi:hypothetical protein